MKREIKAILIALITLAGIWNTAFAVGATEITDLKAFIDNVTLKVEITGTHQGGAGRYIAVRVFREETPQTVFYENDLRVTATDGSFSLSYFMDGKNDLSGKYIVKIKGTNAALVETNYMFYNDTDPEAEKIAIEEINGVTVSNRDTLNTKLNTMKDRGYLSISLATYNGLNAQELYTVNNSIMEAMPFASFADVDKAINAALAQLNTGGSSGGGSSGGGSGGGGGSSGGGTTSGGSTSPITTTSVLVAPPLTNQDNPVAQGFTDIVHVPWAVSSINALVHRKIVEGTSSNTFEPDRNITREEFVKLLVTGFGLYNPNAETDFMDIDKSAWYYPYVASAKQSGIVNGKDEYYFGIGEQLSREDMSVMVYRVIKKLDIQLQVYSDNTIFNDDDYISNYAREAVYALSDASVLNGVGGDRFAPKDECTRAMAAKVIYNVLLATETDDWGEGL